ncbi:MAG: hypothetical protein ACYTEL_08230 [Planctomycetota bacterium]
MCKFKITLLVGVVLAASLSATRSADRKGIRQNDAIPKVDNQDVTSYCLTATDLAQAESGFSRPIIVWSQTYDQFDTGIGEFVRETPDGGFIVVGLHRVNNLRQHLLVKTDSEGKIVWHKSFKENRHHWDSSVEPTSDGGYIFGGGATDAWLIKFNSLGEEIWQKSFGGEGYQYGRYAHQTKDGGYILAGAHSPTSIKDRPRCKLWLIKTDSAGNTAWAKTFGSDKECSGTFVQQTKDEGYIVAGAGWGPHLLKTNSLGNIEWKKTVKGNYGYPILLECVQQTQDGGYVFVGWSTTDSPDQSSQKSDINLFKTDSSGNMQWRKVFDRKFDDAKFVQQTRDGGYIIAGNICDSWRSKDHDIWIIKTDPKGEITWQEILGGDYWDRVLCIQQTADGGYVFTGSYGKSQGWGGKRLCLVRFK